MKKILALLLCLSPASFAWGDSGDKLEVVMAGHTRTWTIRQLKKNLKLTKLTVSDPTYHSKKTYEGFLLKDVLALAGLDAQHADELALHSRDGYTPTFKLSQIAGHQGLLAIREVGAQGNGGWTPLQHGKSTITPAPFYLVWDSVDHTTFPWPYQLVQLEVIDFKPKYGRIFPSGVDADSAEARGFNLMKAQCLKCHSLNLQGGELGPELNVPKNITEYRDENYIREFVRNPATFRLKSKMPPFPQIKDSEFADLMSYLRWIKDRKKSED